MTNTQVSKLLKAFGNNSLGNIKLSKTKFHKIGQSGELLGRLLRPLLKTGLPLIENVVKPLAKSFLIPLGLTAVASAADAAIHEKMFGLGTSTLIISKEEMHDIIKINKTLEKFGLLIKKVSETIQIKAKVQKGGFLSVSLCILGARLLGNLLTGTGVIRSKIPGQGVMRAGEGWPIRAAGC